MTGDTNAGESVWPQGLRNRRHGTARDLPLARRGGFVSIDDMRSVDVIVLGAGITGVSVALHLQARGWRVCLVDDFAPGEVSSRGNSGLLARTGFTPLDVPQGAMDILARLFSRSGGMRIEARALPALRRFLKAARVETSSLNVPRHARALAPLQAAAIAEHLAIARAASAFRFFRRTGWIKIYRTAASHQASEVERHFARIVGIPYEDLDDARLARLEPDIRGRILAAVHWPDSQSVSSPGGVTKAYARLFRERGGEIVTGDPGALSQAWSNWTVPTAHGEIAAEQAVLALGSGTLPLLHRFGLALPLATLRNRHGHFRPVSGVSLSRPVSDVDGGFLMTPMERGIRLIGDEELTAGQNEPADEIRSAGFERQVTCARALIPLGSAVEDVPVIGHRVLTPDGLPVLGPVPGGPGLWMALGHGADGFSLAPAMGRLLSEMMSGDPAFVDPVPFTPARLLVG
jgi:D-amino-acid dehydrogenase